MQYFCTFINTLLSSDCTFIFIRFIVNNGRVFSVDCLNFCFVLFFQNLHIFFLHEPFQLDEIPSFRCTEASSQSNTPTTMFHCRQPVLWVVCLSIISPNICSVSVGEELSRLSLAYFSLAWTCLFCRSESPLGLQTHSPFLCTILMIVCSVTTTHELAKSFVSVLPDDVGSVDPSLTSFLSKTLIYFASYVCLSYSVLCGSL